MQSIKSHLKFLYDLVDKWNEVIQFTYISMLQQTLHSDWDKRKNVGVKTDDHAMQKLPYTLMQRRPLDWNVQCMQKHLECLHVHLGTTVHLHRLLPGETFTRPTVHRTQSASTCMWQIHKQTDRLEIILPINLQTIPVQPF